MLKINDKYYVDVDAYNYILIKKHIVTEAEASKRKNAVVGAEEFIMSENYACIHCNYSMPQLETRMFSFNSPTLLSALKKLGEIESKKLIIESDYHKNLGEFIKDLEKMNDNFGAMLEKSCYEYLKGE